MLARYKQLIILILQRTTICIGLFTFLSTHAIAQNFSFSGGRKKQSISFKLIKNLIIIPIYINDKGPFDFVLDTGVGPMIITDPTIIDSLNFNKMRKIKLTGLGGQDLEAYIAQTLDVKIGRTSSSNIPVAVLKEDLFNLSGYLGLKIYGLVGHNFFDSFVVDIRYGTKIIKFNSHEINSKYKGKKTSITIDNQKPYINLIVELEDGNQINAKFLIDTGASNSLSLEMLNNKEFPLPATNISANLGLSISGPINGFLARIKKLDFGVYSFKNVIGSFPNYKSILKKVDNERNGVIGAEILSRFNIQLNYRDGFMYIRPNVNLRRKFEHNMVGMTVYLDQKSYKRAIVILIQDRQQKKPGCWKGTKF